MSRPRAALAPFLLFVEREGLSFGQKPEVLRHIQDQSDRGVQPGALLDDPVLSGAGVGAIHLLQIRRALARYQRLQSFVGGLSAGGPFHDSVGPRAARFAERLGKTEQERVQWRGIFALAVSETLQRGRLRMLATASQVELPDILNGLVGHTEGCLEIPPHRWFALDRGLADRLLIVEVIIPELDFRKVMGVSVFGDFLEELKRSATKAVLARIKERCEAEVITTAADALYGLLSRPCILKSVAGVATDGKRCWVHVIGDLQDGARSTFEQHEVDRLAAWIVERGVVHVGLVGVGGHGNLSIPIRALSGRGLSVEIVREAGLMKQAREPGRSIKEAAAEVAAKRLRDPLQGYAGLSADELGLGEYLDRVDQEMLRAALEDVRHVVQWERKQGKTSSPVARGVDLNPMVLQLSDLRPGMELTGTVVNLTHFGAFVELGLPVQGLVHLSELADRFIQHPSEAVKIGDRVKVRVVEVDIAKERLSLSMKQEKKKRAKPSQEKRIQALSSLDKLFKKS